MTRLTGTVPKAWGREEIFVSNDHYCGKFLIFDRAGARFSMHFHRDKHETWHVLTGYFRINLIDTQTAKRFVADLGPGDTYVIKPLLPHQIECLESGRILEVSTPDSVEDNYRVEAGDSQKHEKIT